MQNVADSPCAWLLRATHSSDDSRVPYEKRRSTSTTARRMARGDPKVPESMDWWPGEKANKPPQATGPEEVSMAEPSDNVTVKLVLRKSASRGANKSASSAELRAPLTCAQDHFRGKKVAAPKFPICDLGLSREEAVKLHGPDGAGDWWGQEFQIGRAPFDAKY